MNNAKKFFFLFIAFASPAFAQNPFLGLGVTSPWASGNGSVSVLQWDNTASAWKIGIAAGIPGGTMAGRTYTIQVGGSATNSAMSSTTSAAVKTFNMAPGTTLVVTHWLWAPGQSNWFGPNYNFTAPPAPVNVKTAVINIRNRWKSRMRYKITQDGNVLRTLELDAGAATSFQIQTLGTGSVIIKEQAIGWSENPTSGEWEENGVDSTEYYYGEVDPNTFSTANVQTPVPSNTVPATMQQPGTVTPNANPTANGSAPVFTNTATGALDSPTYKEGVGILSAQLQAINQRLNSTLTVSGGSGGGGSTDMSTTNGLLSEIKGINTAQKAETEAIKSALTGGVDPGPVDGLSADSTDLAPSSITSKITGKLPAAPTVVAPTSATAWSVSFNMPGYTTPTSVGFDLTNYSGPVAVFRGIALAGLGLLFFFITLKAVRGAFA